MLQRKILLSLAAACVVLTCAGTSFAAHNASVLRMSPAADGGKYLNVQESNTLKQWRFNVGVCVDYAYEPLEFRAAGTRQRGIVDDLVTTNFQGAIAWTDWFLTGVNFPFILYETFYNPNIPATEAVKETLRGKLGDLRLDLKFRLLDIERFHVGLSVIPFVYFPTGSSTYMLGTGMLSPGVMLAVDGNIKNRVYLSINAGYRSFKRIEYFDTTTNPNAILDDSLILNFGANVRVNNSWSVLAEVVSEGVIDNFWQNQEQNPAEWLAGVRYTSHNEPRGLSLTFTGGRSITDGIGSPDFRFLIGVNYRPPKKPPPPEEKIEVEEKIVITQRIHFEFDKAVIRPVSYPVLQDVVAILQRNPQIKLLRVEGHTDWLGSDEYNLKLSDRRASAVRDFLIMNGIEPGRLTAAGYGEFRPIGDNNTVVGRALNRRTEFTVIQAGAEEARAPQVRAPAEPRPQPKPPAPVPPPPPPPPQPQPLPKPAAAALPSAPVSPSLGEVKTYAQIKAAIAFPNKESELTDEGKQILSRLADYVRRERSVIGVRFEAFPGKADSEMGDSDLSWKRAANAQNYFTEQIRVSGRSLDVSSYGFANQTFGEGADANKGKVVIWVVRKFEK